jgi:Phosphoesterase family
MSTLPHIKTVVMLMLENRSLDMMLGWLHRDGLAPAAANPDGINGASGFGFDRMGPRVPAILVSPYVEPRTVFRPPSSSVAAFDHTSIIKTVLRWAGTDESFIAGMGKRVAEAPTFDSALNAKRSMVDPPHFTVPNQYRTQGGKKGYHHLPKWAESLSIDDHRIALSAAIQTEGGLTVDGYLSALEQRASTRGEQQQE